MVGRKRMSGEEDALKEDESSSAPSSSEEDEKKATPVEVNGSGMGEQNDWGLVQTSPSSQPGGLLYLPLFSTELNSRALVVRYLHLRLHQLSLSHPTRRITITITPSSPNLPTTTVSSPQTDASGEPETLNLLSISPVSFTLLLLSPTPQHALRTLSQPFPQTLLEISNQELFLELFTPPAPAPASSSVRSNATRWTHWIRERNPLSSPSVQQLAVGDRRHWVDSLEEGSEGEEGEGAGWSLPLGLAKVVLAEWVEEGVMRMLGVGFVKGGEGWRGVWRRSGRESEEGSEESGKDEDGKV
ncbi:hypothetical protein BDY24DRAFT_405327, partial [Mrakia frigida]|uniref:uncharacterized protein n=1 Tax=Mrakia frigida TaxID=29902 RepID=UPI003FCBF7DF